VSIRDTGCGMRADVLERIFEPFTTKPIVQGTGLSLSITTQPRCARGDRSAAGAVYNAR
jgi:signal transduction histidine kinase